MKQSLILKSVDGMICYKLTNIKNNFRMRTFKFYTYSFILLMISLFVNGCVDNVPEVETLPSPAVDFAYKVIDDSYQLDYYVGATIEFTSLSGMSGDAVWDFGDGTATESGNVATHRYSVPGTYQVKLTIDGTHHKTQPIMVRDIVPIMSVDPIEDGICEVLATPVSISMELPNPEGLSEEYLWIFPEGTTNEAGEPMLTSTEKNPGKMKFSHVGSQAVRLQVKLAGRPLQEGKVNVQVGYNEEVPTLYYAVKGGNIMALKLVNNKPDGMKINPFDMEISSGKHPFNILFKDPSLYILDAGQQFTWVNDVDGNLGDGRITVMSKDGAKFETMLTNTGTAFDDPFYGFIDGNTLYFSDRNTGVSSIPLGERNRVFSRSDFPFVFQNQALNYYNNGISWGAINACFTKIDDVWYWLKTYNGTGIFRFKDADILKSTTLSGDSENLPADGHVLGGTSPKSIVWDSKNQVVYFTILDTGFEGLYRCTPNQLKGVVSKGDLLPYQLKTASGKSVTPITEAGRGEGSTGEFIGICQLALDEATGDVYFGLRSDDPDVKSGLMRYNATTGKIEHVIEGVDVYGVAVNNVKSKLF